MVMMLDTVDLDADPDWCGDQLQWVDQHEWSVVAQDMDRSLAGKLMVQEGIKRYGRPITLASNDGAWFPWSVVRQLEELRDQISRPMPLTLPTGERHFVIFRRTDGAELEARQIHRCVDPAEEPWTITLRLITVAPPPPPPPAP